MKPRRKLRPTPPAIRVRAYEVLRRAVEDGAEYGWRRAHKYTDSPDAETVREAVVEGVMGEIGEWFEFGEEAQK